MIAKRNVSFLFASKRANNDAVLTLLILRMDSEDDLLTTWRSPNAILKVSFFSFII